MIELTHLEKKYENAISLKDVNTVIRDGDVISKRPHHLREEPDPDQEGYTGLPPYGFSV